MFDKNEMILDRVRSLSFNTLDTRQMLFRLTSLEDSQLSCTAEGEEITDAIGSLITTLYRAKKASFTANNSLFSFTLLAEQYGATKEVATEDKAILDRTYDILNVAEGKITLSQTPKGDIRYIYGMADGEVAQVYEVGADGAKNFSITGKEITVPTDAPETKFYVEYDFDNKNAMKLTNRASEFPRAGYVVIYAYFRDKCDENKRYSGKIICPKAKLNPSQIDTALTSTGKHPFELTMMKDYCDENDELFTVIISQE